MICFESKWFSFVRSLFIMLKYQSSNVELLFSIKTIESENSANFLPAMMNDGKMFSKFSIRSCQINFERRIFILLSRKRFFQFVNLFFMYFYCFLKWDDFFALTISFVFCYQTTFLYFNDYLKSLLLFFFQLFSTFYTFDDDITLLIYFLRWNQTCSKSVFIQYFSCYWFLIRIEKIAFSILFDASDEKINIYRYSVRCNKVEIFFFNFLNDSVRLIFNHDE